jgi:hypothetical protein
MCNKLDKALNKLEKEKNLITKNEKIDSNELETLIRSQSELENNCDDKILKCKIKLKEKKNEVKKLLVLKNKSLEVLHIDEIEAELNQI